MEAIATSSKKQAIKLSSEQDNSADAMLREALQTRRCDMAPGAISLVSNSRTQGKLTNLFSSIVAHGPVPCCFAAALFIRGIQYWSSRDS